ncbi:MAG TPA: hypothetical protein VK797_04645 [Tepidisphaeraceae bacterium]|jgi:hypothetical protein|nr:hypothetical protein [Tepidisphaeraceae bacterium]
MWSILQLGAIALSAWRVPLAAQFPQPPEFGAVRVLIVVQFMSAALLSPVLLADWQMGLAALCSGGTLLLVAAVLAAWSLGDALPLAGYLAAWLICLSAWMKALGGAKWRMVAAGIAAAFSAGGPLLWYLGQDLGSVTASMPAAYGPLWPALVDPRFPWRGGWLLPGLFLLAILCALTRAQVLRQTRH